MKTSSDTPKFFAWEVRTFDYFKIPADCWLKLKVKEKNALSFERERPGSRKFKYKYLCMIKNKLYLSDGNLWSPHLPPSRTDGIEDDHTSLVKHAVRLTLTANKTPYAVFSEITDEEAEEIYLAEEKRKDKFFKLTAKHATRF